MLIVNFYLLVIYLKVRIVSFLLPNDFDLVASGSGALQDSKPEIFT